VRYFYIYNCESNSDNEHEIRRRLSRRGSSQAACWFKWRAARKGRYRKSVKIEALRECKE
jgi:hypothetical protein